MTCALYCDIRPRVLVGLGCVGRRPYTWSVDGFPAQEAEVQGAAMEARLWRAAMAHFHGQAWHEDLRAARPEGLRPSAAVPPPVETGAAEPPLAAADGALSADGPRTAAAAGGPEPRGGVLPLEDVREEEPASPHSGRRSAVCAA